MAKVDTFSFSVSETGESTGETYNWAFTVKRLLSVRDRLNKDNIRRGLLGDRPLEASPDSQVRAEILSHIQVSLVESPKDWREAGNGLDLCDENILMAIYEKITLEQNKVLEKVIAVAKEKTEKLRTVARKAKGEKPEAEPAGQKDEGTHGGA